MMSKPYEYEKGDRIRVVLGSPAAPEGTEATVIAVQRDATNTIVSLHIFIDSDPAHIRGTCVYPREIELIR